MVSRFRNPALVAIAVAVGLHVPQWLVFGYCVTGLGGWKINDVLVLAVTLLGAGLIVLGSVFMLAIRSNTAASWSTPIIVLCGVGLYFATLIPGTWLAWQLRTFGFYLAAGRASPLVEAIRRYEDDTGLPPPDMSALVPNYLAQIPHGLPRLDLISGEAVEREFPGNTWWLEADVSVGVLNFDRWMYLPQENYPASGPSGTYEPVGGWVYYHE